MKRKELGIISVEKKEPKYAASVEVCIIYCKIIVAITVIIILQFDLQRAIVNPIFFRHPRRWTEVTLDARFAFRVGSNNVQAANTREPDHSHLDKTELVISLQHMIDEQFDVICLQELQRCTKRGCRYCSSQTCALDHSKFAHDFLIQNGYQGSQHLHEMKRTVGLYYKTETFDLVGRMRYVDFNRVDKDKKGAVLAFLQHKHKPEPNNQVLVATVHFSVPKIDSQPNTTRPLQEARQLFPKLKIFMTGIIIAFKFPL